MKKSTLLLALGGKPPEGDDDAEMDDTGADAPADDDGDAGEDQAEKDSFETLMDDQEDTETRMEALRTFIKICTKAGY